MAASGRDPNSLPQLPFWQPDPDFFRETLEKLMEASRLATRRLVLQRDAGGVCGASLASTEPGRAGGGGDKPRPPGPPAPGWTRTFYGVLSGRFTGRQASVRAWARARWQKIFHLSFVNLSLSVNVFSTSGLAGLGSRGQGGAGQEPAGQWGPGGWAKGQPGRRAGLRAGGPGG